MKKAMMKEVIIALFIATIRKETVVFHNISEMFYIISSAQQRIKSDQRNMG